MRKLFSAILVIGVIFSSCQKEEQNLPDDSVDQVVPGQYIVVLKKDLKKSVEGLNYLERIQAMEIETDQIVSKYNISKSAVLNHYNSALRGFAVKLDNEELQALKDDDKVAYVVQDKVHSLGRPVPVPPDESIPYGINRVGYGDGTGKTAWIIDTGIDLDHPDLNVDAARSAVFTARDKTPDDNNGHGSHCAGTVAALDNEIGVVGVAAGATVVAVKVLDRRGSGYTSWIIAGIDYVVANASPGDAANMSLGGGVDPALDEAVYNASQTGIFFALAAGNESDDSDNHSPARVDGPNIWTISAMDINDDFAYFSNYGDHVDYCMPGVSIFSTYKDGGFATMSGTSMAAPHMCGVLLMTNGNPKTDGYVNNDPDGNPDPVGHL